MQGYMIRLAVGIDAATVSLGAMAQATDYPAKPVSVVVPGPPGGGIDFFARIFATEMGKRWKIAPIVDYRNGAAGLVGAEVVAKAKPDGYTLLMTSDQTMTQAIFRKISFDPERDLVPIAIVASTAMVCVTHPDVAKNWAEFVAKAKANPGALNYVDYPQTTNALNHLRLWKAAGIRMTSVPYNGQAPGLQAVLSGTAQLFCATPVGSAELARTGKLVGLATTGREQMNALPNVRTLRAQGLDYEWTLWFGMLAPTGTPAAIIAKVQADLGDALSKPDVQEGIRKFGFEPELRTPVESAAAMTAGAKVYRDLAREFNVKQE